MQRKFSYLVLGTGVGKAIAWWLLQHGNAKRVTLADNDYRRAEEVVRAIGPGEFKTERLMPTFLSTEHQSNVDLLKTFERFDVIISAIPARHSPRLARLAVMTETHFCDLGGVIEATKSMLELDGDAKEECVSVIPDCGLMPGLGNMMAQDVIARLGIVDDLTIYVGGIPQKPQPPHYYQQIFSLEGLLHILNDSPIVRDSQIVTVPPGAEQELLSIPQLKPFSDEFGGTVEAFITAGAGIAHDDFKRQGVKNFCEKTIRWPGFLEYIRSIPRQQLLEQLTQDLPPTNAEHPDLVYMRVVGKRNDTGQSASWELLDTYDPVSGLTAMQRTTGFSAAAVAYMAALGSTTSGVHPPEMALPAVELRHYLGILKNSLDLRLTKPE